MHIFIKMKNPHYVLLEDDTYGRISSLCSQHIRGTTLAKIKKELSGVSGHSILADGVLQEMVQSGKVITKIKKKYVFFGRKDIYYQI